MRAGGESIADYFRHADSKRVFITTSTDENEGAAIRELNVEVPPLEVFRLVQLGNTAAIFPEFKTWKRRLGFGDFCAGVLVHDPCPFRPDSASGVPQNVPARLGAHSPLKDGRIAFEQSRSIATWIGVNLRTLVSKD